MPREPIASGGDGTRAAAPSSARVTTYTLRSASPAKTRADAVVVGVARTDKGPVRGGSRRRGRRGGVRAASSARCCSASAFTGKAGEVAKVPTAGTIKPPLLVLVGLGDEADVDADAVRRAAGVAARNVSNAASVALALPADTPSWSARSTEGYVLGGYTFTAYKKDTAERPTPRRGRRAQHASPGRQEAVAAFETRPGRRRRRRPRPRLGQPARPTTSRPPAFADAVVEAHATVTKGRGAPKVDIEVLRRGGSWPRTAAAASSASAAARRPRRGWSS